MAVFKEEGVVWGRPRGTTANSSPLSAEKNLCFEQTYVRFGLSVEKQESKLHQVDGPSAQQSERWTPQNSFKKIGSRGVGVQRALS